MIKTLLDTVFKLTISGSVMVAVIMLLRFVFKTKLPRSFIAALWIAAFAAFVVPVNIPAPAFVRGITPISIAPAAVPLPAGPKVVARKALPKPSGSPAGKMAASAGTAGGGKTDPCAIAAAVYLSVGATLLVVFSALYLMTLRRFRSILAVDGGETFKKLRRKAGVRRNVAIGLSCNTAVPVTAGVLRPKIILPEDFDTANGNLFRHICAHELTHIRRHDNAVCLIALAVACIHWFNPLAWAAYSMLCRDTELACDSGVVRILGYPQRAEYADSLIAVAGGREKIKPIFFPAFGKYNIKKRVLNVMNTRRLTKKALCLCAVSVFAASAAFTVISCSLKAPAAARASSSGAVSRISSQAASSAVVKKDLTNDKYKKIFQNFAYNYYCENVSYAKNLNYSGKITGANAEAVLRTAIDQNQSGISVDNYTRPADFNNPYGYAFPRDIGEKIIKSCFDVNTVDPSLFKSYNAKTQKYELDGDDFASGTDYSAATVVRKITQEGSNVYVTADFYKVKGSNPDGTAIADMSSKIKSMKFTFKVSGGKYLYEQAESI